MHEAFDMLEYFACNEFIFTSPNAEAIWSSLSMRDKKKFNFDARDLDYQVFANLSWQGGRKYLLKEDETTYAAARRRLKV